MAEIEEDIENGRHGTGARKLTAFLAGQPDSDEANYLLGTCEMARGKTQAADAAWARVKPGSRFAAAAILGRMQIQMELGRLSAAEKIIKDALDDPRIDGSSLPILLGPGLLPPGPPGGNPPIDREALGRSQPGRRRGDRAGDQFDSSAHRSPPQPDPDRGNPLRPR